jgi:hypothetical protein
MTSLRLVKRDTRWDIDPLARRGHERHSLPFSPLPGLRGATSIGAHGDEVEPVTAGLTPLGSARTVAPRERRAHAREVYPDIS